MGKGHIERLPGGSFRIVVYAGKDPITGRKHYLKETHPTEAAALAARERLLAQIEGDHVTDSSRRTLAVLLDRWMEVADHQLSTREATEGYIRRTLKPALGDFPLRKLQHRVDVIDRLYTHLRRCGGTRWPEANSDDKPVLCDGTPYTEHKASGPHDCATKRCTPHVCRPMAPTTIRRIHGILSPALNYAVSWGWIERNPAEYAHPPKVARRKARPPEPEQVVQVLNQAAAEEPELFVFLWTAVTTGARRGEVVALRWNDVERKRSQLVLATNYIVRNGQTQLKGTKTEEERRLSLDTVTLQLLADFREARAAALTPAHLQLPDDAFVFSPDPLGSRPWHPDHFTHAYRDLARPLGVTKPLKNLRHFNATQLLSAGVDLSTVAARLGHADGGATTLRVYASWTQAADRNAVEHLAGTLEALRHTTVASPAGENVKATHHRPRPLARVARPIEEIFPEKRPTSTYRDVAAALHEAITTGRIGPGDLVPTITDLATHFDLARSTVQRAIASLDDRGCLHRAGHRWHVADPLPLSGSERSHQTG